MRNPTQQPRSRVLLAWEGANEAHRAVRILIALGSSR